VERREDSKPEAFAVENMENSWIIIIDFVFGFVDSHN
jgi:hypothetical protein